ncbi:hypothetical protein ES703_79523 [subsurface metagenome]
MGPPNISGLEKPASSVIKITMLGASSGKRLGVFRHWCFESFRVLPATLADGGSGKGKTSWADSCAVEHSTKIARMAMMIVVRVFICLSPFFEIHSISLVINRDIFVTGLNGCNSLPNNHNQRHGHLVFYGHGGHGFHSQHLRHAI